MKKVKKCVFLGALCLCTVCLNCFAQEIKENPMKITINIYYTGKNDNARKFAEEMEKSGTVSAIRREKGNRRYEYFYPKDDDQTVLLIDSWESQEALDKHHASPMMETISKLREKYDLHMKVERYTEDISGIPATDKNFIKE